jgi:hypothetical protein
MTPTSQAGKHVVNVTGSFCNSTCESKRKNKKLAASSMLHEAKVAFYASDVAPRFLILLFMPLLWLR